MKVLFLLAGRASRFKESGFVEPKALIPVRDKSMLTWATDALCFLKHVSYIFLCLKEHENKFHISKILQKQFGTNITIILVDGITQGAAVTALLAKDIINTKEELIISNADQFFTSKKFQKDLFNDEKDFSGLIPVFEGTHPRWSFAKINSKGFVTEVAEKVPISNHATVGVYYFKHGQDFVWAAEEMIRKDIRRNNEFYVCPVFNELIGRGDKIKAEIVDSMWSLGTPEDVLYFEKYFK